MSRTNKHKKPGSGDRRLPTARDYVDMPAPIPDPPPASAPWRPRWRTVTIALLALSLVVGAGAVLNSPLMKIRSVTVEGTRQLSPEAVIQIAGVRSDHFLLADLRRAEADLRTLPLVKEASLSRTWPNQIRIAIRERTPWAAWQMGDAVYAIDAEGVVLEGFDPPSSGAVVRQISSLPEVKNGATVDLDAIAIIRLIEANGPPERGPAIIGYEWSLRDGLTVVTEHGRITFGGSDGFDFKFQVWEQLETEAWQRGEPLILADLRFGARPAVEIGLGLERTPQSGES
ncbi:MAG: FtsQ-type POTRA domain-containing protein [Chloroflexi bacterium]|nr:FtsQ-type POTRA domain-containing protein [Chloroflexota bacterium]